MYAVDVALLYACDTLFANKMSVTCLSLMYCMMFLLKYRQSIT